MRFLALIIALGSAGAGNASAAPARWSEERLPLTLESGRTLSARLRLPAGASAPLPAVMVFGGFKEAAKVLDLVNPGSAVALASFDYPFDPPRRFSFPSGLRLAPAAKRTLHRTVEGMRRLSTALAKDPRIDAGRISVIGASFGGPLAVLAAAEAPAISGIVLVHGFGRIPRTIGHQFEKRWRPALGSLARVPAGILGWLSWVYMDLPSPENAAGSLRDGQRVFFISASDDTFIPKEASDSLWAAVRDSAAPSERLIMPGDHLQPGSEKLISRILQKVETWMIRHRLLGEAA